ncbi:tol-pal system protein YbgF [Marinobacter sp. HN1S83]|uniref:tol-pal system protein YbgF n=1 Tax=Marinobacter sp. HN1S83 TaxID=3382301 RepID=UPI00387B02B9
MRYLLMATAALSLAFVPVGGALAQSATPVFQDNASGASNKASNSQANAELFYMIQQLQGEVRRLQGEVEVQRNLIDRLSRQSRDRYIDLDQRILELSETVAAASSGDSVPSGNAEGSDAGQAEKPATKVYRQPEADERQAYEQIQDLIHKKKDYDEAISRIYDFVDKYPEGDLSVNAYYWLGEVYLVKPQLEQAKQAFTIVATRYEDHRKAPDAVYKLGVTLDRLGEKAEAKSRMESVVGNYPDTKAAELAQKYLDSAGS